MTEVNVNDFHCCAVLPYDSEFLGLKMCLRLDLAVHIQIMGWIIHNHEN
uniref:Uncharacterized protein n=1 Tax=Anguilla anguilla TaxID=7936 RepID=A0A0E9SD71_ANGAN